MNVFLRNLIFLSIAIGFCHRAFSSKEDINWKTALFNAIVRNDTQDATKIIEGGWNRLSTDCYWVSGNKGSVLHTVIRQGFIKNSQMMKHFLFLGADPEEKDEFGDSSLKIMLNYVNNGAFLGEEIIWGLELARDFYYANKGPFPVKERFKAFMENYVRDIDGPKIRRKKLRMIMGLLHLGSPAFVNCFFDWMGKQKGANWLCLTKQEELFFKSEAAFYTDLLSRPTGHNLNLDARKMDRVKQLRPYCAVPYRFFCGQGPRCKRGAVVLKEANKLSKTTKKKLKKDTYFARLLRLPNKKEQPKKSGTSAYERKKLKMDVVFFFARNQSFPNNYRK